MGTMCKAPVGYGLFERLVPEAGINFLGRTVTGRRGYVALRLVPLSNRRLEAPET